MRPDLLLPLNNMLFMKDDRFRFEVNFEGIAPEFARLGTATAMADDHFIFELDDSAISQKIKRSPGDYRVFVSFGSRNISISYR